MRTYSSVCRSRTSSNVDDTTYYDPCLPSSTRRFRYAFTTTSPYLQHQPTEFVYHTYHIPAFLLPPPNTVRLKEHPYLVLATESPVPHVRASWSTQRRHLTPRGSTYTALASPLTCDRHDMAMFVIRVELLNSFFNSLVSL